MSYPHQPGSPLFDGSAAYEAYFDGREYRETLLLVRDNIRSLINAYPDRFPRHAFQGTLDRIVDVVGDGSAAHAEGRADS